MTQRKIKIGVSVMAHPSREEFFPYLKERLKEFRGEIFIAVDKGWGVWQNCKFAWKQYDPEDDYHIVIQDDAIVCDNFKNLAAAAIEKGEKLGCGAMSFYFGKKQMLRAVAKKGLEDGYVKRNIMHWGLAICLPTKIINEMMSFGDKINIPQDDARISYFLQSKKIKIYYPIPSLINHRIGKSLVNDPGRFRQAFKYIDENKQTDN